jgi:hypothetical protein
VRGWIYGRLPLSKSKKNMSSACDFQNVLENFGVEILNKLSCVKIFLRNISL